MAEISITIENKYFGEGATSWKETIFQITWQSQIAFAYDKDLNRTRTFNYSGEGWGLATWGDTLVMSDGSENIYLLNPKDFSQIDRLQIYDQTNKFNFLNELESNKGRRPSQACTEGNKQTKIPFLENRGFVSLVQGKRNGCG